MPTPQERLRQFCAQGRELPGNIHDAQSAVSYEQLFVWRSIVLEYIGGIWGESSYLVSAFSSLTDPNAPPARSSVNAAISILEQAIDFLDDNTRNLPLAMTSSRALFISHATRDAGMVKDFVRLIEVGIGLPSKDIFCTSMPGSKIQGGRNFRDSIRKEAAGAKMVIALISPAFMDSPFCWSELGAGWVLSDSPDKLKPFVVDPIGFSDVAGTVIGGLQTFRLSPEDLSQFRDEVSELVPVNKVSTHRWDEEKNKFIKAHCSPEAIQARATKSMSSLSNRIIPLLGLPEQAHDDDILGAVREIVALHAAPEDDSEVEVEAQVSAAVTGSDASMVPSFFEHEVELHGERIVLLGSRIWKVKTTWQEIFLRVGLSLESVSAGSVHASLARKFAQVSGNASISNADWTEIQLELSRRNLVNIRKVKTTAGSFAAFWSLTDQGRQVLNGLRTDS